MPARFSSFGLSAVSRLVTLAGGKKFTLMLWAVAISLQIFAKTGPRLATQGLDWRFLSDIQANRQNLERGMNNEAYSRGNETALLVPAAP
jgi:hypothetical protein